MENKETNNKRKAVAVEVINLSKSYDGIQVLKNINLSIEPGEIFVIMGPSGSGKSVMLKNIIGLETPDEGKILIDGKDTTDAQTHNDIRTGIVFQAGALFNSLNVFDNLALYHREHKLLDKETIKNKVEHALEILSLKDAAKKFPSELSGGMRKRAAIARSLVMEPQLLLYDEPTSELDPSMAATITQIIATVPNEVEVTSIVVSHDRDLAFSIADRIAIIMDGKILSIDKPQALRNTSDQRIYDFLNPRIQNFNKKSNQAMQTSLVFPEI